MPLKKPVGVLDEVDFVELRFLQVIRKRIEEKGMTHQGVARLAGLHTSVVVNFGASPKVDIVRRVL